MMELCGINCGTHETKVACLDQLIFCEGESLLADWYRTKTTQGECDMTEWCEVITVPKRNDDRSVSDRWDFVKAGTLLLCAGTGPCEGGHTISVCRYRTK